MKPESQRSIYRGGIRAIGGKIAAQAIMIIESWQLPRSVRRGSCQIWHIYYLMLGVTKTWRL